MSKMLAKRRMLCRPDIPASHFLLLLRRETLAHSRNSAIKFCPDLLFFAFGRDVTQRIFDFRFLRSSEIKIPISASVGMFSINFILSRGSQPFYFASFFMCLFLEHLDWSF